MYKIYIRCIHFVHTNFNLWVCTKWMHLIYWFCKNILSKKCKFDANCIFLRRQHFVLATFFNLRFKLVKWNCTCWRKNANFCAILFGRQSAELQKRHAAIISWLTGDGQKQTTNQQYPHNYYWILLNNYFLTFACWHAFKADQKLFAKLQNIFFIKLY